MRRRADHGERCELYLRMGMFKEAGECAIAAKDGDMLGMVRSKCRYRHSVICCSAMCARMAVNMARTASTGSLVACSAKIRSTRRTSIIWPRPTDSSEPDSAVVIVQACICPCFALSSGHSELACPMPVSGSEQTQPPATKPGQDPQVPFRCTGPPY